MKKSFLLPAVVFAASIVLAQAASIGTIRTIAGGGTIGDGGQASNAMFGYLGGVAVDAAGNTYVTEGQSLSALMPGSYRVRKIAPNGVVTTIAGTGTKGFTGDGGPAVQAQISTPGDVVVDGAGNVYFTDLDNNRVRRIDASDVITTVAGNGTQGFSGDGGAAAAASLNGLKGLAIASDGALLIADAGNARVRRVANGIITTVAGNGTTVPLGGNYDAGDGGPATQMAVGSPWGLAADPAGGFYVVDYFSGRIRHVDAGGTITTISGKGGSPANMAPNGDGGSAINATSFAPRGIARDAAGNLYFADYYSLRKIDTSGIIRTVAGTGTYSVTPSSAAPDWIALDGAGNVLFVEDYSVSQLRKLDAGGNLSRVLGGVSAYVGDGGPAVLANIPFAPRAAVTPSGDIYIPGVRHIDTGGTITAFAPGGAIATDAAGRLYMAFGANGYNNRAERIESDGSTTIVAGNGLDGLDGDGGLAVNARVGSQFGLTFDRAGDLFITQFVYPSTGGYGNTYVRKVDTHGIIATFAGNGTSATSGDGGPATSAGFYASGTAVDRNGNMYIADSKSHRVRRIDTAGIITTFAGTGVPGFAGDGGSASAAQLNAPSDVAVDDAGNVYIADTENNRIRRVDPSGIITTFAGNGVGAFGGEDVVAATSSLWRPAALSFHPSGDLLVGEAGPPLPAYDPASPFPRYQLNARLRRIAMGDASPLPFAFAPQSGVPTSTPVQSEAVTPTGFDQATRISVSGGEYSVGCNGTFTTADGVFMPGQSVCVRHTSAALGNDIVSTNLVIGGTGATFRSTTVDSPGSVSVTPATLDFGTMWTNMPADHQSAVVTNTGTTDVTVLGATASGDFPIVQSCSLLAPGASCTLDVGFMSPVAGVRDTPLTVRHTAGNATLSLRGVAERSLTSHYYETILGRAPDPAGFTFWEGEAQRVNALGADVDETWFAMAMSFYASAEYAALARDDRGFVTDLYHTFFNREPDAGGLDYWSGLVSQGMPRGVALASFMFSPEFNNFAQVIFGNTRVRGEIDMVTDFYRGILGRLPDNDGFAHWLVELRKSQCAGAGYLATEAGAMALQFEMSTEYANRHRTNEEFVGDLYNAFLRRGGDLPGVQYWLQQLVSGTSREVLLSKFVQSPEFQARTQQVAAEGCLPQ